MFKILFDMLCSPSFEMTTSFTNLDNIIQKIILDTSKFEKLNKDPM